MGMNLGHRQQMFAALGALFIAVSLMQVARAQTPAAQIPPAQASTPAVTPETPPPAAPAASAVPPHTPVTPSVQPSPQAQAPASPPVASPGVPGAATESTCADGRGRAERHASSARRRSVDRR